MDNKTDIANTGPTAELQAILVELLS